MSPADSAEFFEFCSAEFKELCDQLEATKQRLQDEEASLHGLERSYKNSTSRVEELETQITRVNLEVNSLKERITYMKRTALPALHKSVDESKHTPHSPDAKRRRELEKNVKSLEASLERANAECEGLEYKISELQERVVAARGKKFQNAKRLSKIVGPN